MVEVVIFFSTSTEGSVQVEIKEIYKVFNAKNGATQSSILLWSCIIFHNCSNLCGFELSSVNNYKSNNNYCNEDHPYMNANANWSPGKIDIQIIKAIISISKNKKKVNQ